MSHLGLALSGGGFRATLFHLGVIRYMRDAGTLEMVEDIASVSGGSILAAHLVLNWDRYTGNDEEFAEAAAEVIRFVQFDVRNHIVRRLPMQLVARSLAKLSRWESRSLTPNALLERYYKDFLYGDRRLFELPEKPGLHILTTNVSDGVLAVFNREGVFIERREEKQPERFRHVPGRMASIAKVVAASSAFPGFFPPVTITADDLGVREGHFPDEAFTDGGVYDNLGTRAFAWLSEHRRQPYDRVIVSDAGKPFQILGDASLGFVAQSIRASDILWDRVWQLERENFGDQNGYFFVPVTHLVNPAEDPACLHPVVQMEISSIRTDLDRFNDLEINALVAHGYEVTRSLHHRIADRSPVAVHEGPPWEPIPGRSSVCCAVNAQPDVEEAHGHGTGGRTGDATTDQRSDGSHSVSHLTARQAGTSTQARIAEQLRRSSERKVWSTLFDFRDWPSYLYLLIAVILFGVLPVYFYRVHRHAAMLTSVINSIAEGDPDIRLVLDLVESNPMAGWVKYEVRDHDELSPVDFEHVDILSRSRILDLRGLDLGPTGSLSNGRVRSRDRILMKFKEEAGAGRKLVFRSYMPMTDVEFRHPADQPPIEIRRIPQPKASGTPHDIYEMHVDLSSLAVETPVTIEIGATLHFVDAMPSRIPYYLEHTSELLTVWMLFPDDHPYRSYKLVRYPIDAAVAGATEEPATGITAPEPIPSRYTIDHPYGRLLGWSAINPRPGMVYECRWTGQ
jgi:predicted acylesterase/phospholipase RssA